MPKKPPPIDRNELASAIELLEEDGPLPSMNLLYSTLANILDVDVAPNAIKERIEAWGLETLTGKEEEPPVPCHTGLRTVLVPRGEQPHRLKGTDFDTVDAWIGKVADFGIDEEGVVYAPSAIIYFVRHEYDIFSPEYKQVRDHIRAILGD